MKLKKTIAIVAATFIVTLFIVAPLVQVSAETQKDYFRMTCQELQDEANRMMNLAEKERPWMVSWYEQRVANLLTIMNMRHCRLSKL
jgi:hypothetical protein